MSNPLYAGTAVFLGLAFFDETGSPDTPTAVLITVTNKATNQVLRPEAALPSPSASMRFTVYSDENTLVNPRSPAETRHVKARATYANREDLVTVFEYQIVNADY